MANEAICAPGVLVAGRYELVAIVGTGGMGEVWRAHDRRLRRDVGVKLLATDAADHPAARRRFATEARAACVSHPHIVSVYDFGEEPTPYIVMELLDGRTLADDIARGPLSNDEVRLVGDQVLDALAAAHARGLLHRDLKPANVLWAGPSGWKVADFGIAASIPTGRGDDTTVPMMGTRGYMAPERIAGAAPSVADDLFAVGALLRVAAGDTTDAWLAAVIARATSADPGQRFASADAMRAALRDGDGDGDGDGDDRTVAFAVTPPPPARRRRARTAVVSVFAAAAVVTAGAFGLVHHRGAGPAPTSPTTVATRPTTTTPTTVAPTTVAPAASPPPTPPGHDKKPPKHPHPPHRGPAGNDG